jgi:hypothetical protein
LDSFGVLNFSFVFISITYFQCMKMLDLVHSVTFSFSFPKCIYILYLTLVRSKLKFSSVWNVISSTGNNKLERIQQKFSVLCFNFFFPRVNQIYNYILEPLRLNISHNKSYHLLRSSLFKFSLDHNCVFLFLDRLVLELPLVISEKFLSSLFL